MSTIIYFGDFLKNNGPSQVDLALKKNLNNQNIIFQQANEKPSLKLIRSFFLAKNIHVSGVSFYGSIFLIIGRILGKFCTYTMHGYLKVESQQKNTKKHRLYIEQLLLLFSNKIIVVSAKMQELVHKKKKTIIITNGVDFRKDIIKFQKKNIITLIGGGRLEKQHLKVCQAVDNLIKKGHSISINLFGEYGPDTDKIRKYSFLHDFGFTNKEIIYKSLQESKIFIQYSSWESFSLSVADAIQYECGIITSINVGINDYIQPNSFYKIVKDDDELELAILELLEQKDPYMTPQSTLFSWKKIAERYSHLWTYHD